MKKKTFFSDQRTMTVFFLLHERRMFFLISQFLKNGQCGLLTWAQDVDREGSYSRFCMRGGPIHLHLIIKSVFHSVNGAAPLSVMTLSSSLGK